jgi:hypothetical protein
MGLRQQLFPFTRDRVDLWNDGAVRNYTGILAYTVSRAHAAGMFGANADCSKIFR